jgi:hypothetical protein
MPRQFLEAEMRQRSIVTIAGTFVLLPLLCGTSSGQNNEPFLGPSVYQNNTPKVFKPTPRFPDGRVNLATAPGEKGHWIRTRREFAVEDDAKNLLPTDIKISQIPFQPWAKALFEYRRKTTDRDSPHARCKPSAGPRQIQTAYGFELVEFPELKQVFLFEIGGPHSFRIIYMDGRPHPKDLKPSYFGHSIGRWEGDALVVDTVGFNEKHWIDNLGLMHTDQYHQIERFTRLDFNTLKYEVTVDDPGAYTEKWTGGVMLRWADGYEVFEYICQQNNQNPEMVTGDDGAPLSRANAFTP